MTEMFESSEIAQLVERQWKKWLLLSQQRSEGAHPSLLFPTVTISRERGSGGGIIGKQVADRLHFVAFDSEIVDHVARSASVDRMVVMHMDERSQRSIKEWTDRVIHRQAFTPQTYMTHLTKTILTAGEKGRSVIIGRGAHLLLPEDRCFRVRVIAPLVVRIERLAISTGVARAEAEVILAESDKQRTQFTKENFNQVDGNPRLYDFVINTAKIELSTASDLIVRAVVDKFPVVLEEKLHSSSQPEQYFEAKR